MRKCECPMVGHVSGLGLSICGVKDKVLVEAGKDVSGVVIGLSWMRIVAVEVDLGHDRCFFHLGDCCFVLEKRTS